ncbi:MULTISPECIES: polysaccharide deacetylase family protein [Paenibacillus]|uniref:polysaccharide deacetylase family protein n=1 Tax=Paenibacillus TaxID=44249 RepID=UPI0022B92528|nr:polysaccharide deacetylase family protein [Paenibacillus caseinilyticus]MCZ8523524.1 DUF2334 domain-containing protein [Paenibacillus caseinilyticus]
MHPTILNNIHSKWVRRLLPFGCALLLFFYGGLLPLGTAQAANASSAGTSDIRALVVYSNEWGAVKENVRLLDLYLGQFTRNITFKSDDTVTAGDFQAATHLVYYGKVKKTLPPQTVQLIREFRGPALAIGENIGQLLDRFSFLSAGPPTIINQISKIDPKTGKPVFDLLDVNYPITHVELKRGEALYLGWRADTSFPLFSISGGDAYYASDNLYAPFSLCLGEGLAEFFGKPAGGSPNAYIRLEDVHPMSDPALLKETGDYLADRGIPFMIAVIPVYTNAETLKQYHLSDSPELVEVLQHLQERGGSIALHGYTHQYRATETGEGFEFWDVVNNTPIWGPSDDNIPVKQRHEFASQEDYSRYVKEREQFEESYIVTRIESGIHELAQLGLYPLAFEAPHYTMSPHGYEILARYFNYILGQVQISGEDWEHMGVTPYPTSPSYLHGMTLLPETLGYYDNESLSPEADLDKKIDRMLLIQGGTLGMFYHPYLRVDKLKVMISHIERVPGLKWLDLKQMNAAVQTQSVAIATDASGHVTVKNSLPPVEAGTAAAAVQRMEPVQLVLWGIAILVTAMVLMFAIYTFSMRMNLRKQLFEERSANG